MGLGRFYTPREVAERTGIKVAHIYAAIARHELRVVRLTPRGGIYIGEAAAAEWLAAREQAPTAAIPSPRMVVARVAGRQRGGDISDLLPPPARRRLQ